MSSIYSLLKKGRLVLPNVKKVDPKMIVGCALHPECKLINVQSVADDIQDVDFKTEDFLIIPRSTPSFTFCWLEAIIYGQRTAVQIIRAGTGAPDFRVTGIVWHGVPDPVMLVAFEYTIAPSGEFTGQAIGSSDLLAASGGFAGPEARTEAVRKMSLRFAYLAAQSFARMNCANVAIEPMIGPLQRRENHKREPSIVWHEIKVTSVPKIGGRKGDGTDPREVRSHWVRGHYADYSKGRGLFGREELRKVFWIPEHKAGSPELGEVVGTYKLV